MLLRKTLALLSTESASFRLRVAGTARDVDLASSLKPAGLIAAACMALALGAAPAHAQEHNPEESEIVYEDTNPPGGGTENNPGDSVIVYEDYPVGGLPGDEGGNNALPIGDQPPGAVPEPATLALLLAGAASALLFRRRRTRGT